MPPTVLYDSYALRSRKQTENNLSQNHNKLSSGKPGVCTSSLNTHTQTTTAMDLIKRSHMDVWTTLQTVSDRDKMDKGALDPCSLSIVLMASSASWGDGPSIHPSSWPAQRRDLDGHGIVGIWMYLMLLLLSFVCFLKSTSAFVQIDLVCINFWPLLYVCCFHNFHNIRGDCISAARHTLLPFQQVTRPGHRGFCLTSRLTRRLDFCTMRTCHVMSCGIAKSMIR